MPYMTYFKNGKIVGCGNAEDDIPKGIDTVDFNNPKLTDAQIEKRINRWRKLSAHILISRDHD